MKTKLDLFKKGDEDRTILDTDPANEIVKLLNALAKVTFIPEGSVSMKIAEDGTTITFNGVQALRGFLQADDGSLVIGTFRVIGSFTPDPPDSDG